MAVIAGYDGLVVFGSGYTTSIKAWTVNFSNGSLDTTAFSETWTRKIVGVSEWSGTYSGLIDSTDMLSLGAIGWLEGAITTAQFVFDANTSINGAISGTIIITGMDASNAVDGVPEVSFTFRGSAAPVILLSTSS